MSNTKIAMVSTYLPRRCGLATFTSDLRGALCEVAPRSQVAVCAIDRDGLAYGPEVTAVIRQDDAADYRRAARTLAAMGTHLVMIQHEYGIFEGPDGAHVLELAAELRKRGVPYTVTLHTVLSRPSAGQAATLRRLCDGAARVTVFTDTARDLVAGTGLAALDKLVTVPHGAPALLRSFVDPQAAGPVVRAALDAMGDARVLSTFGLLGPGKGVEHAIAALPRILRRHPDVVYLVAGATHPEVARRDGESYRRRLTGLATDLGVAERVLMLDAFLSDTELAVLLARTHLFLTPYRSPEQICSGALTFALTAGCPVVSTDYRYARDMLTADGRDAPGVLVPCGDAAALGAAVTRLLADGLAWRRAARAADTLGARLTWPSVATRFADVILAATRPPRPPDRVPVAAPPVRLDHLRRLTDDIGIIQFANGDRPAPESGYCVDDVARLGIVAAGLARLPGLGDPAPIAWQLTAARFLAAATAADGLHNLMTHHGTWLDEPHLGDHVGRAVWGLGILAATGATAGVRDRSHHTLGRLLPLVRQLSHPRSIAYALLGLAALPPTPPVRRLLHAGLARLTALLEQADPHWPWCEPALTYDNGRLPEAMLRAAARLGRPAPILSTVDWYLDQTGLEPGGGPLRCVGNRWRHRAVVRPDEGDEQPIDAAATVELAVAAWQSTGQARYAQAARHAFAWFLGANRAGVPLYDVATGGCRDGLSATAANVNQGAESTLAYYQAMLAVVGAGLVPAAAPRPAAIERARPRLAITR